MHICTVLRYVYTTREYPQSRMNQYIHMRICAQATIRQHLENVAALEEKERSEMLAMAQGSGAHGNQKQNSGMDMSAMMSMMGTNTARLSKAQKRRLRAKQRK